MTSTARIQPPGQEDPEQVRQELEQTWAQPPGLLNWIKSVDHKSIAKRYIVTAFVFFVLAGLEAAVMRAQLARPENTVLGPDAYNQFFTMHGVTMMFLFAVPIMEDHQRGRFPRDWPAHTGRTVLDGAV